MDLLAGHVTKLWTASPAIAAQDAGWVMDETEPASPYHQIGPPHDRPAAASASAEA
jgi:hypothetical protein